jgi:diguanylate cyclase (GGDEF)-like protein
MLLCVASHHQTDTQCKQFLRHVADVLSLGLLRRYAEQEAVHLAYFNALTGLPNRRLMQDRLQQELERSTRLGTFGALLAVDLDRFQTVNDALGHDKGDLLLIQLAEKMTNSGRKADTLAHLGGDDFLMLLPGLGQDSVTASYSARVVTEKINANLSRTYNLQGNEYQPTFSMGIAIYPADGDSAEELMRHVDTAKYSAKQAGRNTMRFYRPDMQSRADYRFNLSKELQHAVRQKQFELHYQPQVDNTGSCQGRCRIYLSSFVCIYILLFS